MTQTMSTPAPQDTWTETTAVFWQHDEPALPDAARDDNPYANLTEWDVADNDNPDEIDPDADSDGYPLPTY